MIEIDGAEGEGGGQIMRTSLSLSAVTGKPFTIRNIRARRSKPGLMRQHLTAVRAAAEICGASVEGADVGSRTLVFRPGPVKAGDYVFRIGSAGSTGLVLQTVLAPLALARAPSSVAIEGGTHNTGAPPFDFLDRGFFPLLRRMGHVVSAHMRRPGFYPAGGGIIEVVIGAPGPFTPLILEDRGAELSYKAEAVVANLPADIAKRELAAVGGLLGWPEEALVIRTRNEAAGPGNCLMLTMAYEHVCEVVTAFGRIGASSEAVAAEAVNEARAYLARPAPVGSHLADQLILPLALAAGGRYVSGPLSEHTRTNIATVSRFLDVRILISDGPGECCMIEILI
jgi:RNA 3'-terminal phosphate cyclase (ATP)